VGCAATTVVTVQAHKGEFLWWVGGKDSAQARAREKVVPQGMGGMEPSNRAYLNCLEVDTLQRSGCILTHDARHLLQVVGLELLRQSIKAASSNPRDIENSSALQRRCDVRM
jgi:hypothetical protein